LKRSSGRITWSQIDIKKIASIDIVLGGDHGQGKFRAVIKIIMRFVGAGVEPIVVVIKVGHIEAKKDTYRMLLNAVTPSMNEAIKRIKQGGVYFEYSTTQKQEP
jgi:hypothetical protein